MNQPELEILPSTRAEERAILVVTCLAAFLFFNSFGSIGVALPAIQKQFGNGLAEIQWITLMGVVTISSSVVLLRACRRTVRPTAALQARCCPLRFGRWIGRNLHFIRPTAWRRARDGAGARDGAADVDGDSR